MIPKPELPYPENGLEPHISSKTLSYHYGKHHMNYYNFISKTEEAKTMKLEEIIKTSNGAVFNNAAQCWNHSFYWNSMKPNGGGEPNGKIKDLINQSFGSFDDFKAKFTTTAAGHFGSGWVWLVETKDHKLVIQEGHDAMCPLRDNSGKPILGCDIWEHAYYLDYQNARPEYLKAWWNLVNWDFANANLE